MEEGKVGLRETQLKELHEKIGAAIGVDLVNPLTLVAAGGEEAPERAARRKSRLDDSNTDALLQVGNAILTMSNAMLQSYAVSQDERMLRSHIILEEIGELMIVLAKRKEAKVLNEVADCVYALYSAAVTFDLPIEAALDAIHASNMTKKAETALDRAGARGKDDEGFVKSDFEKILRDYRRSQGR